MKRFNISMLLFAAAAALPAVVQAQEADYTLNVEDFSELTVVDGVTVTWVQRADSAGYVRFRALPEMASQITFTNNRNRLTIQTAADDRPIEGMPRVYAYSALVRQAENDGDSVLTVVLTAPQEVLRLKQVGNGSIEASGIDARLAEASVDTGCGSVNIDGRAREVKLRNIGTGSLDAAGLVAERGKVFIFGPGPVECNVTGRLTVYGMGSGKAVTHVTPAAVANRSIGVKVVPAQKD